MQIGKQTIDDESDRGVSPVIGVILMVAITVILAAVIGTFVLQLGQDTGQVSAQAGVSFSQFEYGTGNQAVDIRIDSVNRLDALYVTADGTTLEAKSISVGTTLSTNDDTDWEDPPGGSTDFGDLSDSDVVVIGEYQGENTTINSYTVD